MHGGYKDDKSLPLRVLAASLAALSLSVWPVSAADALAITTTSLPVFDRAVPDNRFGLLTYLGGLGLDSRTRHFRALSGLAIADDNRLIMVTDEGYWVTATLDSSDDGTPTGLSDALIGPLLDSAGQPMLTKRLADAEAAAIVGDEVWVAFERNQPIRAYSLENDSLNGAAKLPFGEAEPIAGNRNQGLEAMVHIKAGPLAGETLIFLEEPPRRASDPTAARLTEDGRIAPFAVRRMDGFAITGAAALPNGDVITLERRFSWDDGIFMRLQYLPANDIANGAVRGRPILEADGATLIDNMEGIAITDHPNGPILTLISDDNANFFQRTVLLSFQLTGDLSQLGAFTPPVPVARPNL